MRSWASILGGSSQCWMHMAKMTNLTSLKLSCTDDEPGIEHIAGLPLLETLVMQDCRLQPADLLSQPNSLPSLRTVCVETPRVRGQPARPFLHRLQSKESTEVTGACKVEERLVGFQCSRTPLYNEKATELGPGEQSDGILEIWTRLNA